MKQTNFSNQDIADALDRIADLLKAQDANRYRVNAYRRAARVVSDWETSVSEMGVSGGEKKLKKTDGTLPRSFQIPPAHMS